MRRRRCYMLRRAGNSLVIALVAALFGFTGILHITAVFAQVVFFVFIAVTFLSLLFSLFEPPTEAHPNPLKLHTSRTEA